LYYAVAEKYIHHLRRRSRRRTSRRRRRRKGGESYKPALAEPPSPNESPPIVKLVESRNSNKSRIFL
jgi:hypothetical protein